MSDVFISYASEDLPRIRTLIDALQHQGWSTFWDRTIPAGQTWRRVIGDELAAARCIVVVWSQSSVVSTWVHEEADAGLQRGTLIPIAIDRVQPPLGFRAIQVRTIGTELNDISSQELAGLMRDIGRVLDLPTEGAGEHRISTRNVGKSWSQSIVIAVMLLLGVGVAGVWWLLEKSDRTSGQSRPAEENVQRDQSAAPDSVIAGAATPAGEVLNVTRPDALTKSVLSKRYSRVTIHSVAALMPNGLTLVADEIEGKDGGALIGKDFSIFARSLANVQVNASGEADPPGQAGSVWIYAKTLEYDALLAKGVPGRPGANGGDGQAGADGRNGSNATCLGFNRILAGSGEDGGKGANGDDGESGGDGLAGGQITVVTEKEPVSTTYTVDGGAGSAGGRGGAAGAGGRGGVGGRGWCPDRSTPDGRDGRPGLPGNPGHDGRAGKDGAPGRYQLRIVPNFDHIVDTMKGLPIERLHAALKEL